MYITDSPQINKYEGEPVNRRLTKGYNNTFHCDIKKGTPKPTVTWYFGWDNRLKKVDSQYDSRYSHPTEEEWTITGVTLADKDKYRCIATNEAGEDSLRFEITQVDGEFLLCYCSKRTKDRTSDIMQWCNLPQITSDCTI